MSLRDRAPCVLHVFPWYFSGFRVLYAALVLAVISLRLGLLAKAERYLTILC